MRCYSLFAGIGGFDLALQNQGHEIVGACEIDNAARRIYAKNFGNEPSELDAKQVRPEELPDFDLLCAGFPCQAFSIAGKRLGFEESRGTLFFEIARIAKQKRPRYLLLENVEGLLFHARGKTFANILATLDELGYDAEWQVFYSKYFVPQNRPRVIIIGHLRGQPTRKIFPITGDNDQTIQLRRKGTKENQEGGNLILVRDSASQTCRIYDPKGIARTLDATPRGWGGTTGIYYINGKYRKLTPLECERVQGFSDNWTDGFSDIDRCRKIGNAVPVPLIEFIVECLTKEKDCSPK